MARIEVNDLEKDEEISKEEMKSVFGGLGGNLGGTSFPDEPFFPNDPFFPDEPFSTGGQSIPGNKW